MKNIFFSKKLLGRKSNIQEGNGYFVAAKNPGFLEEGYKNSGEWKLAATSYYSVQALNTTFRL